MEPEGKHGLIGHGPGGASTSATSLTVFQAELELQEAGVSRPGPSCCLPLRAVSPSKVRTLQGSPHWPGRGYAPPGS